MTDRSIKTDGALVRWRRGLGGEAGLGRRGARAPARDTGGRGRARRPAARGDRRRIVGGRARGRMLGDDEDAQAACAGRPTSTGRAGRRRRAELGPADRHAPLPADGGRHVGRAHGRRGALEGERSRRRGRSGATARRSPCSCSVATRRRPRRRAARGRRARPVAVAHALEALARGDAAAFAEARGRLLASFEVARRLPRGRPGRGHRPRPRRSPATAGGAAFVALARGAACPTRRTPPLWPPKAPVWSPTTEIQSRAGRELPPAHHRRLDRVQEGGAHPGGLELADRGDRRAAR